MKTLKDRVAVVTGAASGIGLAMAQAFAAEGMKLVLADIEQDRLDAALHALRAQGATAVGRRGDAANAPGWQALAPPGVRVWAQAWFIGTSRCWQRGQQPKRSGTDSTASRPWPR